MARRARLPAVTVLLKSIKDNLNATDRIRQDVRLIDRAVQFSSCLTLFRQIQMTHEEAQRIVAELTTLRPEVNRVFLQNEMLTEMVDLTIESLSMEFPS